VQASEMINEFFAKRVELLEQVARRQADIDTWMNTHSNITIDRTHVPDLAQLLALVFLSREALQELADLDASVIERLHEVQPPQA
jgi:hypothetical protein